MIEQFTLDFKLSPDAVFANYVGDAAARVRASHGWCLVWGTPGSGRSHLLQAACHDESRSVFFGQLARLSPEILRDLEHRRLVCLDDIDEILGDPEWEEALFHLMNGIKDRGGRLLMSAATPANQFATRLPDLESRLKAATAIQTDVLDDRQKLTVLMQRARSLGFELSEEVGRFILSRSPRDVTALIDMLKRLELETLRQHKRVTIPFVKRTLEL